MLPGPELNNDDDHEFNTAMDYEYFGAILPNMGPVLHVIKHWMKTSIITESELENSGALLHKVGLSQAADAIDFAIGDDDALDDVESLSSDRPQHQRSAYQQAQPSIQDMTKYAEESETAADLMVDGPSRLLQQMEELVLEEQRGGNVPQGEIAFPAFPIDKQKQAKQLKPYYSPTKTKKKTKYKQVLSWLLTQNAEIATKFVIQESGHHGGYGVFVTEN
jgi:hypothetical protein